jgi:hypothetical protein
MFVIECALIFLNESARKLFLNTSVSDKGLLCGPCLDTEITSRISIFRETLLKLLAEISASVLLEDAQLPTDSNHVHFWRLSSALPNLIINFRCLVYLSLSFEVDMVAYAFQIQISQLRHLSILGIVNLRRNT